ERLPEAANTCMPRRHCAGLQTKEKIRVEAMLPVRDVDTFDRRDPVAARPDALKMQVILAQPRGFCAGVVRAIEIVERALEKYGPPVYVRHEIVHNRHVVESLKAKGARFVENLSEVPPNAVTIFSAHGV